MKGRPRIFTVSVFILVVVILFLRPTIVFRSHLLQSLNYASQGAFGIAKAIKKRKEGTRLNNLICKEVEDLKIGDQSIDFWPTVIKKHLREIYYLLSFLLSLFVFRIRRKSTLFQIIPGNDHYLALSVIRI